MSLKTMSKPNSGNSPASQTQWDSVTCAQCGYQIFTSVVYNVEMNVRRHFQLEMFKTRDDKTAFSSSNFTCAEQNHVKHKDTVECPHCKQMFWLCIDFKVTYQSEIFGVKVSITTETDENQGSQQRGNGSSEKNLPPALKRVKVSYICTGETFGAQGQVKKKLELNLPSTRVEETSLEDCSVIILFCPITSRVGSDVESCMANKRVSMSGKPVILVLMHHTRDTDYSTAGTSWSEVYNNVVLDVHLFFHETKPGLLACRQNDEAFSSIAKELQKHSLTQWSSWWTSRFSQSQTC